MPKVLISDKLSQNALTTAVLDEIRSLTQVVRADSLQFSAQD